MSLSLSDHVPLLGGVEIAGLGYVQEWEWGKLLKLPSLQLVGEMRTDTMTVGLFGLSWDACTAVRTTLSDNVGTISTAISEVYIQSQIYSKDCWSLSSFFSGSF